VDARTFDDREMEAILKQVWDCSSSALRRGAGDSLPCSAPFELQPLDSRPAGVYGRGVLPLPRRRLWGPLALLPILSRGAADGECVHRGRLAPL